MKKITFILFISLFYTQNVPFFDGEIAFKYLEKQCSFGERFPGSQSHIDFKNYLVDFFNGKADDSIYTVKDNQVYLQNDQNVLKVREKAKKLAFDNAFNI